MKRYLVLFLSVLSGMVFFRIAEGQSNILIYGCVTATGIIKNIGVNVPKCRPKETVISWNQTGPQGTKGDTGAVGPKGNPGNNFVVRDKDGQFIGYLQGPLPKLKSDTIDVFLPSRHKVLTIRFEDGKVMSDDLQTRLPSVGVYFSDHGCSGRMFVQTDIAASAPDLTQFYPEPAMTTTPVTDVTVLSHEGVVSDPGCIEVQGDPGVLPTAFELQISVEASDIYGALQINLE